MTLFSRKSSARTGGSGPPPIQLTTKTFYLCILMDICKSKSRFMTSQTSWEALARAPICVLGKISLPGALRALGSAWEGGNRQVTLFSRKSSARTAGSGTPPMQLATRTFYLCILMDICKSKTHFTTSQTPWESRSRAAFLRFGLKTHYRDSQALWEALGSEFFVQIVKSNSRQSLPRGL